MRTRRSVAVGMTAVICSATLGGCVVGPNYKGPPATARETSAFRRGDASTPADKPVARWWTALRDPELDSLIEAALKNSPSVDAAEARLRQARAQLRGQRLNRLPSTGASALYLRTRNVNSLLGSSSGGNAGSSGSSGALNLYAVGFDATWELDFFGASARAVEAASAAAQVSEAHLADVRVSLSAEVGDAYVQLRDAQARLALTHRNVDIDQHLLQLYELRRSGGTASELDVTRIVNQLDTTRATLAPLRAAVTEQLDRLAVLTGHTPGALDAELASAAPTPQPPDHVAIGDPAALLRRRPDIVAAERTLAQRTAVVGENVAAYFPRVNLLGEVGFASLTPGALLNSGNFSYILAPVLQWSPWDFGRNHAKVDAARAGRDEAEDDYRQTVLEALRDAEDSLARYSEQRNSVADLARARASAQKVYALTELRLRGGTADTTDVLDADTRRIQADIAYQQALAGLTEDYVALQKSLGLGWVDPLARN